MLPAIFSKGTLCCRSLSVCWVLIFWSARGKFRKRRVVLIYGSWPTDLRISNSRWRERAVCGWKLPLRQGRRFTREIRVCHARGFKMVLADDGALNVIRYLRGVWPHDSTVDLFSHEECITPKFQLGDLKSEIPFSRNLTNEITKYSWQPFKMFINLRN